MTNLEKRFQVIKNSRRNGYVGFEELCNTHVTEKHGRRIYDSRYAHVMDVDDNLVYTVINNAEPSGSCFVFDAKKNEIVQFTTYREMRDNYKARHNDELYKKALAKVEKLKKQLEKAEAELAKFNKN